MRQTRCLFVLAGYSGDIERPIADLRSRLGGQSYDFIGRTYPSRPDKLRNYVREIGRSIVVYVFGDGETTAFCRAVDKPCALHSEHGRGKTCRHDRGTPFACFRERPRMLVIVCHARIYQDILDRFGRAALLLEYSAETLADTHGLQTRIEQALPVLHAAHFFAANLSHDMLAPRLPLQNFQRLAKLPITEEAQKDLARFDKIMQKYHRLLHDPDFHNPTDRHVRGGYCLDERIRFQRDRLHDETRVTSRIGAASRADIFHLVNAYHLYGAAILPGMHFDVMAANGGPMRQGFQDIVTREESSPAADHVNISPCDRVW